MKFLSVRIEIYEMRSDTFHFIIPPYFEMYHQKKVRLLHKFFLIENFDSRKEDNL